MGFLQKKGGVRAKSAAGGRRLAVAAATAVAGVQCVAAIPAAATAGNVATHSWIGARTSWLRGQLEESIAAGEGASAPMPPLDHLLPHL